MTIKLASLLTSLHIDFLEFCPIEFTQQSASAYREGPEESKE
jgi:hypothetical protein